MRRSLLARSVATLFATIACSTALALGIQAWLVAPPENSVAAKHLGLKSSVSVALVGAHLRSVQARYEAISRTPQFRANLEVDHAPTLAHYAKELQAHQGSARIAFLGPEHEVRAAAGDASLASVGRPLAGTSIAAPDGSLLAVAVVPILASGHPVGELVALEPIGETVTEEWLLAERRSLSRARWSLIAGGIAAITAALLASLLLWRGLIGPLRRVREAAERIGAGDFAVRVGESRRDEIGDLARATDEMAERLERHTEVLNATVAERTAEWVQAAARAEEASQAKSDFLDTMSHEIRTPLNGILGMTELLLNTALEDRQRELAKTAQKSGEGLLGLINDVLDFSKIESGKLELEAIELRPQEILEAVTSMLSHAAKEKGLALSVEIDPDVPDVLLGDPGRLQQILTNLVNNAIKFTDAGSIRTRVVAGRTRMDRMTLRFEVSDTGIGISEDAQTRLFDPFVQADASTTRKHGGTGLGLAISKDLVAVMSGEIGVLSTLGEGSTFWFTAELGAVVERSATQAAEAMPIESPDLASLGPRVLVAEDNPVNQAVAMAMLEALGCDATLACDGIEAVRCVTQEKFDVILMDCQMPGMDGYDATAAIRDVEEAAASEKDEPVGLMPIIALTANARATDRQRCLDAGMQDYVSKPFTQAQLHRALARWLLWDDNAEWTASEPSATADE